MKRLETIVVCLAGGLALVVGARAQTAVSPDNPYGGIVERNVFGLNPLPPADAQPPGDPPPKISPNGIMTIFGQLQVLFKVASTAKPGQPAKDAFYTLSEGQSQDDIEVVHIDEQGSVVTFNNHGTVQEIPLASASAAGTAAPGTTPGGIRNFPGSRMPSRFGGGPGAAASSAMGYNAHPPANQGYATPSYATPSYASPGYVNQQSQSHVTPEEQAILLEVQRAQWEQQGNPARMIIPPTPLTSQQ